MFANINEFYRELTIDLPKRTKKNGTLTAYVVLTKAKNFKADSNNFALAHNTYSVIKELPLTRYKANSTGKYVNLLESQKSDNSHEKVKDKSKKPMTHMLSRVTIYTMDSQIDFDRYQVPDELIHDIM